MITTIMLRPWLTFEDGDGAGEQRRTGDADVEAPAFPLLRACAGEPVGHLPLIFREDIDGEPCRLLPVGQAVRPAVDAEEDQRRIERQRIEGTDRHPMVLAG